MYDTVSSTEPSKTFIAKREKAHHLGHLWLEKTNTCNKNDIQTFVVTNIITKNCRSVNRSSHLFDLRA